MRGRAHHIVDIENLLALRTPDEHVGPAAGALYGAIAQVGPDDLLTVAADVNRWFEAKVAFPGCRVLPGYGADGADRALQEATDIEFLASRFDTIVIGSGDHWFVDVAYRARQAGLKVVVVSRPASLSRFLAPYADEVIEFGGLVGDTLPTGLTTAA